MILPIIKNPPSSARRYCEWTQQYFDNACKTLKCADIIKNRTLDRRVKDEVLRDIKMGYSRLKTRFDVDYEQMNDEMDTLVRLIEVLPAEQFVELTKIMLTPYRHLEFDEASKELLDKLGY